MIHYTVKSGGLATRTDNSEPALEPMAASWPALMMVMFCLRDKIGLNSWQEVRVQLETFKQLMKIINTKTRTSDWKMIKTHIF